MNFLEDVVRYVRPDFWLPYAERVRGVINIANFVLLAAFLAVLWVAFRDRPRATSRFGGHRRHAPEHSKQAVPTLQDKLFLERWEKILKSFSSGSTDALKIAIIDTDKLVDETLQRFGLSGEHMADRLEKIEPGEIESLDRLWAAHRTRNEIVHTPGYALNVADARKLLDNYRSFFEEVGLLPRASQPR